MARKCTIQLLENSLSIYMITDFSAKNLKRNLYSIKKLPAENNISVRQFLRKQELTVVQQQVIPFNFMNGLTPFRNLEIRFLLFFNEFRESTYHSLW